MSNQNNLYNILAAFNKATQEPATTPKQQAQAIYESVEAKGSIMGGVKGIEKKLSEEFAKHKVSESDTEKLAKLRDDFKSIKGDGPGDDRNRTLLRSEIRDLQAKIKSSKGKSADLSEGKVKQLQMDLEELTDAEFTAKYKMSKAEARKGMNEGILDEPDTVDTPTGRIHKAGIGGYGNRDAGDDTTIPMAANQVARGRGRPKKADTQAMHAARDARRAAADAAGEKLGRGRPKKNPAAGGANSAPQGTLGLHNFLFGPAPKTLPGKPGVKHKMSDQGTERDRVRSITGESARPANFKGYLAESVGTLDHIVNRFKNEVKRFQSGEDLDQDLYEALFDYYMDSGEMPYGVAKARSGDPYEWVTQRFEDEIGVAESAEDPIQWPEEQRWNPEEEGDEVDEAAGDELSPSRARQHYTPDVPKTNAPKKTSWLRDPIAAATDRIYDKIKGVKEDSELNELARLAGIKTTNESASVISGDYDGDGDHDMQDHEVESEDRGTMSVSTNQSSTGTKNVTITADGEAASALLDMLKNAGMGSSDAARHAEERVTAVVVGSDDMGCEQEVEEEYANEPAEQYQSTEAIIARGDDMNRQKKQNFPMRAPGNNPMAEAADPLENLGRDLMAEYQAMKLVKEGAADAITHAYKGVKRAVQGKPSKVDVELKHRVASLGHVKDKISNFSNDAKFKQADAGYNREVARANKVANLGKAKK